MVARGGLPEEEEASDRDVSDDEQPVMCRPRRKGRYKAAACAKALRQRLLSGFSDRKETDVAGLELGREEVKGGEEGEASRRLAHAGPQQGVRFYYKCDKNPKEAFWFD